MPLATDSERQRNSNPRKLYPNDPGLIILGEQPLPLGQRAADSGFSRGV